MSKNSKAEKRRYQQNLKKDSELCSRSSTKKIIQTKDTSNSWTAEEDKILSNLINIQKIKSFTEISKDLYGHSATQCRIRWNKIKRGLKKGQWSVYEDKLLRQWVKENGPKKWEQCGRFIHGRSGKQCREHWNNCLNPELVKGDWTTEEDFLIMYF